MERNILNIYTHEFAPKLGGIATYCHEFSKASVDLGYNTTVYSPKTSKAISNRYTLQPQNWQGNHNPTSIYRASCFLRTHYQKGNASTHLLAEPGSILAYALLPSTLRQLGTTHITVHGSEVQRWRKNSLARRLANRAFETAHSINAVSDFVASIARDAFPDHTSKVRTVLNALPTSYLEKTPIQLPQNPDQDSEEIQLLSVGRLHPRKGFDQIIQALGKLPAASRNRIKYTILGGCKDNSYKAKLHALAKSLQINLSIQIDASDEVLDLAYRSADIFALTSMPYKQSVEGFGIVYLEAGFYGLPCIANDIGGVSQAVLNQKTGLLAPTGDLETLAKNILYFIEDPKARLAYGANNQVHALSHSWQEIVNETLQK
jgi:glycosyltransferase involved in cell wall biosynthesis